MAQDPSKANDDEPAWHRLVAPALKALHADVTMVPGAKLRQQLVQAGWHQGLDVATAVAKSGRSFAQAVATIDGVTIIRVPGSDVLVGLAGSKPPLHVPSVPAHPPTEGLRQDVYEAFTRVSTVPFVYQPERDVFCPEDQAEGASIPVPQIDLEHLIDLRRKFVSELPLQQQEPLREALERSVNPLARFRQVLQGEGLARRWAAFLSGQLQSRVQDWAAENKLTPRTAWFKVHHDASTARRTLERLVPYLTTGEIRDLRIPLRAVEAMLSEQES